MESVVTVWLLSLGVSHTAGVTLSSGVLLCTETCVKTGMCKGPTLPNMIACYINTGHRNGKGFKKQTAKVNDVPARVTEIICVTERSTPGSPSCLFDRCTAYVGPKLAPECRPPPPELQDVTDKVYNCTRGANQGKPTCIRTLTRGTRRSVGDGYEEYKAGNETMFVKEYTTNKTWDEADQQCRSDGARLIKLDSKEKNKAINQYKFTHWMGLKDLYNNDTFFWTDGSPLRFTAWFFNEPSHFSKGTTIKENCAEVSLRVMVMAWNDCDCLLSRPFLCEKKF